MLNFFKNRSLDKAFEENPHSKAAFHLLQDFILNNQEKYQKYEVSTIYWNIYCYYVEIVPIISNTTTVIPIIFGLNI